jgi:hypothetical protein
VGSGTVSVIVMTDANVAMGRTGATMSGTWYSAAPTLRTALLASTNVDWLVYESLKATATAMLMLAIAAIRKKTTSTSAMTARLYACFS